MTGPNYRALIGDVPTFPQAACRSDGTRDGVRAMNLIFFGEHAERPAAKMARQTEAKAICAACPELEACRTWALNNPELIGDNTARHVQRAHRTADPEFQIIGQIIGGMNTSERDQARGVNQPTYISRRQEIRHGSVGGHSAHVRRGEPPCDECTKAVADYRRNRRSAG